jgi:hypothetical protein
MISVFAAVLCLCVAPSDGQARILAVVGTVKSTSARVLLDWVESSTSKSRVLRLDAMPFSGGAVDASAAQSASMEVTLPLNGAPRVVTVSALTPQTLYLVAIVHDGVPLASVSFRTRPTNETRALLKTRVAVVSCNRITEDGDGRGWMALSQHEPEPHIVLHLGDQIYGDADAKWFMRQVAGAPVADAAKLYRETVARYRANYRATWSNPHVAFVLRRGEQWMIPDDHDFNNNLSPDMWRNATLRPLLRAGLQTVYEYQMALRDDVPGATEAFAKCATSGGRDDDACAAADSVATKLTRFDVRGTTAIAMVDVRVERMVIEGDYKLVSDAHVEQVRAQFAAWRDDPAIESILLVTAIPLVFLNPMVTRLVDEWEREFYTMHGRHEKETRQLLDIAHDAHARKTVTLVGGDFHMSHEADLCRAGGSCMRQFVSSGITAGSSSLRSHTLFWLYVYMWHVHHYDDGVWSMKKINMAISPNFLVIEDGKRARAVYDISLDHIELLWMGLWRFFPAAFALFVVVLMLLCVFVSLKRQPAATTTTATKKSQ